MTQVKGFQVTEDTLPIVKYYHQHRLLKHTHHHHHHHHRHNHHQRQQQWQHNQHEEESNEDDDDDRNGVSNNKTNDKGKTGSPGRGGKNKEKFYYTPHLTDQVSLRAYQQLKHTHLTIDRYLPNIT